MTLGARALGAAAFGVAAILAGKASQPVTADSAESLPRPDHTVVVIMENHSYAQVVGNASAPYINSLRTRGANFTDSYGVSHPSEPNYLGLFAGTTENLTDDSCPHTYSSANLASGLFATGQTFAGYSESMPSNGYTGCTSGRYARKHNPWVDYTNVPASANLAFASIPADYADLPTVAFVVPNLCNDMHDCGVATGDGWLRDRIDPYLRWADTHNSLLVLTWDESNSGNSIPTIFVGPMVQAGDSGERIDHYGVLRTLEEMYGLQPTGHAAEAAPIADVWQAVEPTTTPTPIPRAPVILSNRPRRTPTAAFPR
ncbi:MAG TPA: alkaline phosphatase family protein [Thermoanaerobaculia bacterium]|nr:alkaline phosphatase family protein [Thermoanaerobaculia bacterium]